MSRYLPLFLIALILAGCVQRGAPETPEPEPGERPDQESWDVTVIMEMDGRTRARLQAPYLARFDYVDSTAAHFTMLPDDPRRVLVDVYDSEGQPSATVEANQIIYREEYRIFDATGDVVVIGRDQRRIESEHMTWDEAAAEMRSKGFVRITTPTERLSGYDLVADESVDTYSLARITGQVEVEDE